MWGQLAIAGASLLGGALTKKNASNPNKWAYDYMGRFNDKASAFEDPNNQFYTDAIQNQKKSLIDMYLAGARQKRRQLASQGINSNAINNVYTDNASKQAGEQANQFGNQIYQTGLNHASKLYNIAQGYGNMYAQGANYAEQMNTQNQNNMSSGFMNLGSSLLGNVMANNPNFGFGGGNSIDTQGLDNIGSYYANNSKNIYP